MSPNNKKTRKVHPIAEACASEKKVPMTCFAPYLSLPRFSFALQTPPNWSPVYFFPRRGLNVSEFWILCAFAGPLRWTHEFCSWLIFWSKRGRYLSGVTREEFVGCSMRMLEKVSSNFRITRKNMFFRYFFFLRVGGKIFALSYMNCFIHAQNNISVFLNVLGIFLWNY